MRRISNESSCRHPRPNREDELPDRPVQLLVTVDTEEDNWWPTRVDVTARNVRELPRLHEVLDEHGVPPTYLVTHGVARGAAAVRVLRELRERSGAEIGAHLHPWNTPPQERDVAESVSLRGLPVSVQREMVRALTESIEEATGVRPRSFRAGRWSMTPALPDILEEMGYVADCSVLPYIEWHDVPGSPSDYRAPPRPHFLDDGARSDESGSASSIVEVPATSGYNRSPWSRCATLDRMIRSPVLRHLHLHGLLHRSRLMRRISLTPEQFGARDMLELASAAVDQDIVVLNLHFHSNSLLPGCNEYVRTDGDRDLLLARIRRFLRGIDERWAWQAATLAEFARESIRDRAAAGTARG